MEKYTRENYLQDRKNNFINYGLAWEMFEEIDFPNKPNFTKDEFFAYFDVWIKSGFSNLSGFWLHYDTIFEIDFWFDSKNNLIFIK